MHDRESDTLNSAAMEFVSSRDIIFTDYQNWSPGQANGLEALTDHLAFI